MLQKNSHNENGQNVLAKSKQHLLINNQPFEWGKDVISGAEVRLLGGIANGDDLLLKVPGNGEDQSILDETIVDLTRPGTEHFVSKEKHEVMIVVNMVPTKWGKKKISFTEVIVIAYGQYIDKPTMVYTVGYEDGPKQNPEGSMTKETEVFVQNKMIFHATATDKS